MLPSAGPKQLLVDALALKEEGASGTPGNSGWQFKKNLPFLGVPERKVTKMPSFLLKIPLLLM